MRIKNLKNILQLVRDYGRLEINIVSAKNHENVKEYISEAQQLFKKIQRELKSLGIRDEEVISDQETKILITFAKSKLAICHPESRSDEKS